MAEWVNRSCLKCGWDIETRFCALSLLDDVMRKVRVNTRLKLPVTAATTCIAAKLNDEQQQQGMNPAPYIIHQANLDLSAKEINRMELLLLQKLNWNPQPCVALPVLQMMMALVTISSSLHQQDGFNCESFLMLLLEIQLRLLYLLMMQAESTEFRPSVLALSVVYFHLDWNGNEELKKQLLQLFQKLLKISDTELEESMNFCYPIIGYYFHDLIPACSGYGGEKSFEGHEEGFPTLYDRLIFDLIYSSDLYEDLRSQDLPNRSKRRESSEDGKKRRNSAETLRSKSSRKRNKSKKKKNSKNAKEKGEKEIFPI
ncbi:hypothetical protein Anas_12369 [Armadillidium nasatum]|uniref:Cyclin N-terminal domain-containing protein n=1 Tax=Armadillidium nasatum TaxID=96803 RepID=A0A5N5T1Z3_9CRUS|nr:hypothetical protein Anas_12369 [Armadillidium nasatum]